MRARTEETKTGERGLALVTRPFGGSVYDIVNGLARGVDEDEEGWATMNARRSLALALFVQNENGADADVGADRIFERAIENLKRRPRPRSSRSHHGFLCNNEQCQEWASVPRARSPPTAPIQ